MIQTNKFGPDSPDKYLYSIFLIIKKKTQYKLMPHCCY